MPLACHYGCAVYLKQNSGHYFVQSEGLTFEVASHVAKFFCFVFPLEHILKRHRCSLWTFQGATKTLPAPFWPLNLLRLETEMEDLGTTTCTTGLTRNRSVAAKKTEPRGDETNLRLHFVCAVTKKPIADRVKRLLALLPPLLPFQLPFSTSHNALLQSLPPTEKKKKTPNPKGQPPRLQPATVQNIPQFTLAHFFPPRLHFPLSAFPLALSLSAAGRQKTRVLREKSARHECDGRRGETESVLFFIDAS